jgi:hypothetical protein
MTILSEFGIFEENIKNELNENLPYTCTKNRSAEKADGMFATLRQEQRILSALANDLLQPRPEAVANILELARQM